MEQIPAPLIRSLNALGLSNYEANVYAALVLHDNAEAKEIVDFLAISKPSVYEALDRLSDMGLAVKRVSKPARYSAVSPEMAVDILLDRHKKAAALALDALRSLERAKVPTEKEDALWTIYGDTHIEYKIRDLFGKAKLYIRCVIGERYLPIVRRCRMPDIPLRLAVISDDSGLEAELREIFPGKNAEIHVISTERLSSLPPFPPPDMDEAGKFMNFGNILELIVDDEELVMVPPFFSGTFSVLNTRNKGAVYQMKLLGEMNWKWVVEGEEFPFPVPPPKKQPRSRKN